MMSRIEAMTAEKAAQAGRGQASPQPSELSGEDRSKDAFFAQIAELTEAIIAQHGRDFAIGTLVLAAKFVAEGKALANRGGDGGEVKDAGKPG
jgi:hypothetical protein